MKAVLALVMFLAAFTPAGAQELIEKDSPFGVAETADKLAAAVDDAGGTVFARVDHAEGARSVDKSLEDMVLVIFGNPAIGTPIIAAEPHAGLDLPLRVLVYDDGGQTRLVYEDASALMERRDVEGADDAFGAMSGALENLTEAAVAE